MIPKAVNVLQPLKMAEMVSYISCILYYSKKKLQGKNGHWPSSLDVSP